MCYLSEYKQNNTTNISKTLFSMCKSYNVHILNATKALNTIQPTSLSEVKHFDHTKHILAV